MEIEFEHSLNFLDLKLTKKENKITFSIFTKPAHTDIVIYFMSFQSNKIKMCAILGYIHRLLDIAMSSKDYYNELNIIKAITLNNGYSHILVEN